MASNISFSAFGSSCEETHNLFVGQLGQFGQFGPVAMPRFGGKGGQPNQLMLGKGPVDGQPNQQASVAASEQPAPEGCSYPTSSSLGSWVNVNYDMTSPLPTGQVGQEEKGQRGQEEQGQRGQVSDPGAGQHVNVPGQEQKGQRGQQATAPGHQETGIGGPTPTPVITTLARDHRIGQPNVEVLQIRTPTASAVASPTATPLPTKSSLGSGQLKVMSPFDPRFEGDFEHVEEETGTGQPDQPGQRMVEVVQEKLQQGQQMVWEGGVATHSSVASLAEVEPHAVMGISTGQFC